MREIEGERRAWRAQPSDPDPRAGDRPGLADRAFTYSQIVWALLAGWLVFGDLADRGMLLGCTVIIASGLFVFYREAVLGKR